MAMSGYPGPTFQLVDECASENFTRSVARPPDKPLLVKGAVRDWPAWARWSFDRLAELRYPDGTPAVGRFQQGLVEQGATQPLPILPVAPYLRELAQAAQSPLSPEIGLLPQSRRLSLAPGEPIHLDWTHMRSFAPGRRYLADWPVLREFPVLRKDFDIRTLWPGPRWTWAYM